MFDILEGDYIEPAPDEIAAQAIAAASSNAFLTALQTAEGKTWPCGHLKAPENTHNVGGVEKCRRCRREQWNKALRRAVRNAQLEKWEQIKLNLREKERERAQEIADKARGVHAKIAVAKRVEQQDRAAIEAVRGGNGRLPLDHIKRIVAGMFGLTVRQMTSKSRLQTTVRARAVVAMVLLERGLSYPRVAKLLGRGDHSTMMNARKQFPNYAKEDPRVLEAYLAVRDAD